MASALLVPAGDAKSRGLLVVSPHCDDAVFACADLVAAHPGARVVTVFAADPAAGDTRLRPWDADCGFGRADDVMRVRRAEDRAALALIGARPIWLPFRDDQYGHTAGVAVLADALMQVVDVVRPSVIAVPLGIFHRDHVLAHEAALRVLARRLRPTWLAYEDALYRRFPDDPVGTRITALREAGLDVERAALGGRPASAFKRRAVARYASQLRGLATAGRAGHGDAFAPEAYWRLR
jgi:LmbE family N-acetylglucosaminyl deacetylase